MNTLTYKQPASSHNQKVPARRKITRDTPLSIFSLIYQIDAKLMDSYVREMGWQGLRSKNNDARMHPETWKVREILGESIRAKAGQGLRIHRFCSIITGTFVPDLSSDA
jgi:hypothetical protein